MTLTRDSRQNRAKSTRLCSRPVRPVWGPLDGDVLSRIGCNHIAATIHIHTGRSALLMPKHEVADERRAATRIAFLRLTAHFAPCRDTGSSRHKLHTRAGTRCGSLLLRVRLWQVIGWLSASLHSNSPHATPPFRVRDVSVPKTGLAVRLGAVKDNVEDRLRVKIIRATHSS